jgi:hypothetical protein
VRAKILGPNFEHFWLVVWPQVANKCYNIDVRILINAGTLASRVANWLYQIQWYPSSFSALGPIQGYKAQHLFLVTCGRLKRFFLFQA